jgi:hypothetical protein
MAGPQVTKTAGIQYSERGRCISGATLCEHFWQLAMMALCETIMALTMVYADMKATESFIFRIYQKA